MEQLIIYDLPFNSVTLHNIEDVVRRTSAIVSPFSSFDQYRFLEYAKERDIHNSQFHALFDLNVTINVLRLAKLKPADQFMRETAALLALLIITDTMIEIGFGMLEYVQKNSEESACDLINLFRAADNVAPNVYAEIALCKKDKLLKLDLPHVDETIRSFSPELHYNWNMHYMGLLGLVAVSKGSGRPVDKLCKYLKWLWEEFVFSATCILFSIIYFSNRPYKGMLKDIGSGNPDLVLNGIRNAAWDLATAHFWSARVTESVGSRDIWIFCTHDRALREISTNLITDTDQTEDHQRIASFVARYWPIDTTDRIMAVYMDLQSKRYDPRRAANQVHCQQDFLSQLEKLEHLAIH